MIFANICDNVAYNVLNDGAKGDFMDNDCRPSGGTQDFLSDNLLLLIIVGAVILGVLYLIIKAGVKNGILEALEAPECPLNSPCR